MRHFPAFLDLRGRPALIVGGGEVASRKLALLERAGAEVTVVAPRAAPPLRERAARGELRLLCREFLPSDLEGAALVVVATSARASNRLIARHCRARGILVNVVDDAQASSFIVPAIVDRDPVVVAISTGGASPVLARRIRERLEASLPTRLGELARWLASLRDKARSLPAAARRRFFEGLIDGAAGRDLIAGDPRLAEALARAPPPPAASARSGEVVLVGAGPGDPELLTLKALRALQDADVILHDRLVSDGVLDLARRDALKIGVGKTGGGEATSQRSINAALIEHARRGLRVVRLKGGDPYVFGRGGEEVAALAAAGITVRVVPGITAALGAAAAAGIPLTHRDCAGGVTLLTAQAHDGSEPDWPSLATPARTVVFYMGLARIGRIAAALVAHGAPRSRPAAVIAGATTAAERIVAGTLGDIAARCERGGLQSPALLVVGDVVALRASPGELGALVA